MFPLQLCLAADSLLIRLNGTKFLLENMVMIKQNINQWNVLNNHNQSMANVLRYW